MVIPAIIVKHAPSIPLGLGHAIPPSGALDLLVFEPFPSVCAPPFSACCGLWLGRADLEGGEAGTKTGMIVRDVLGVYLSSFLE